MTLGDIAQIRREFAERPAQIIRHDGREALTIGVAGLPSVNIVDVGEAVDAAWRGSSRPCRSASNCIRSTSRPMSSTRR